MASNKLLPWLTKSVLPMDSEKRQKYSLEETFHPDGQLATFGSESGWKLSLEQGVEAGSADLKQGSGGTSDHEYYSDGTYEVFDAWSDNSKPKKMAFPDWVHKWLKKISLGAENRFIKQDEAEATKKEVKAKGLRAVIKIVK